MSTKLAIKIGDTVKTNNKYGEKPETGLKVIETSTHCFINHEQTYLLEDKNGRRGYYGKRWVEKEAHNDQKD